MVGSCATRNREPGQARKGAAVSGEPRVPQGVLAGAGYPNSAGCSGVQGEPHGPFFVPPRAHDPLTSSPDRSSGILNGAGSIPLFGPVPPDLPARGRSRVAPLQ